ncbi:MATE family efflux transporter [Dialister pneumosintes]|uniref:Probable multidrug resistance protein NorM n=1 Tax=Dialister pneumosintes TaxID=39950 RepID=A0A1B3WC27_9FIRM|nr:MATE family efflux transporter [Dialister pneumosintes]AOH38532.1 hypothetical protein BCB69_00100 [Dialister pneumosintes]
MGNRNGVDLIHGTLFKKILFMAMPLALTGIIQQFFNAADIAMIGRFVDKDAMAAVGSSAPIITTLISLFIGLSIGTNVVLAAFIGKNEIDNVKKTVHTSIVLAILSGILLTVIGEILTYPLLVWLEVPVEIIGTAELYLRILFIEMPFGLLYNFESSIFRAIGDTKTPLLALIIGGIIKVFLNLIILLVLDFGASGVAIGSIIANFISAAILYVRLRKTTTILHVEPSALLISYDILKRILKIGIPAGLQGVVFCLSNLLIQSALNSLGAEVMAASAAGYNIEIFVYFMMYSFAQVNTTVVGQNYGAGQLERCRRATKICFLQTAIFSVFIVAVVVYFAEPLLQLFTVDETVIEYGKIRLFYVIGFEWINTILDLLAGSLRGYGNSTIPAVISLIGICGVRITWVYTVFVENPTMKTLMLCYPVSWTVASVILWITYIYYVRQLEKTMGYSSQ